MRGGNIRINDAVDHAAFLVDPLGCILSWNPACERIFGRSASGVLGHQLASLVNNGDVQLLARGWSGPPDACHTVSINVSEPGGGMRSAALTFTPQHGADGALASYIAAFTFHAAQSETELVGNMPLASVIDVLPGTFYVIRADGSFVLWNKTLESVTAMGPDDILRTNALDLYDLSEKQIIAAKMREVFDNDGKAFVEANYLDRFGRGTPFLLCGARIECRGTYYLCGMGLDISQRRAQEDRLRLRERALHATSNGLLITRCDGADNPIEYTNPAFERLTGYSAGEVLGRDPRFMAAPGLDEQERDHMRRAIRERREVNVVLRNRRKSGEIFWNDLTITPVSDARGIVTHFIGVLNDVTAIRQRTALLEHEVNHDALTGLANRTLLWDRLEQAIHMSQRNKSLVATVLLDLNGFKAINDTYGHEAGDKVLAAIAKRLLAAVREVDTVARLSGDEFVLVLVNQPSLRFTLRMIERLRQAMTAPVAFDGAEIAVGASIGVSMYPHDGNTTFDLVRAADAAMYHAKASKAGDVHFFSSDMKSSSEAKQKLEDELRLAVDRGELQLLFQPKVCLHTGRIRGFEALLRWVHPQMGMLLPASFLSDAEETGLIIPIGNHVMLEACAFAQRLCAAGHGTLSVAVNVSYHEFSRPHYVEHVADTLRQYALAPDHLELELREEGLNMNHHLSVEVVSQLRELGVLRSVDAFGHGMSDLNFLQKLPLTHVKLAKVAVHHITAEARSGVVARALIDVGHDLGIQVIAKGVETRNQIEFLRLHNCDEMQGILFSPPLAEPAVHAMLAAAAPA